MGRVAVVWAGGGGKCKVGNWPGKDAARMQLPGAVKARERER